VTRYEKLKADYDSHTHYIGLCVDSIPQCSFASTRLDSDIPEVRFVGPGSDGGSCLIRGLENIQHIMRWLNDMFGDAGPTLGDDRHMAHILTYMRDLGVFKDEELPKVEARIQELVSRIASTDESGANDDINIKCRCAYCGDAAEFLGPVFKGRKCYACGVENMACVAVRTPAREYACFGCLKCPRCVLDPTTWKSRRTPKPELRDMIGEATEPPLRSLTDHTDLVHVERLEAYDEDNPQTEMHLSGIVARLKNGTYVNVWGGADDVGPDDEIIRQLCDAWNKVHRGSRDESQAGADDIHRRKVIGERDQDGHTVSVSLVDGYCPHVWTACGAELPGGHTSKRVNADGTVTHFDPRISSLADLGESCEICNKEP